MTRLDATSEPSMEDILASIRKIIAEDPPGSRATPAPAANLGRPMAQPQAAADAVAPRGSARDTFFPVGSEPAAASPSSEPYLRAEPQKPSPAAFDTDGFFAKSQQKSFIPEAPAARIEPSFAPMSSSPQTAPDARTATLSVDAQLSDLLGDAVPAGTLSATTPTAVRPGVAAPITSSHFTGKPTTSAAPQSPAEQAPVGDMQQNPRQGFTVSRDGFVPGQASTAPAAERDPFDFDLGPSPFEAKTTGIQTSKTEFRELPGSDERPSALDIGGIVPMRTVEAHLPPAATSFKPAGAASEIAAAPTADAGSAPVEHPAAAAVETPVITTAAPSVAATIAPAAAATTASIVATPARDAEPVAPVARFVPANASIETPKSVARDVLEVVSPAPAVEVEAQAHVEAPTQSQAQSFDADAIVSSAGVPMTQDSAHQRTMEETVADLLRPMLRSWLAENMPRIVERALRREITEQLSGDKQEAAE